MVMWLVLIIIVGVIVYYVLERQKRGDSDGAAARETPLDILKKRYARGEISKAEFDRMKDDLD